MLKSAPVLKIGIEATPTSGQPAATGAVGEVARAASWRLSSRGGIDAKRLRPRGWAGEADRRHPVERSARRTSVGGEE